MSWILGSEAGSGSGSGCWPGWGKEGMGGGDEMGRWGDGERGLRACSFCFVCCTML